MSKSGFYDEINRQNVIQSALLAGFAFTGLTAVSYSPTQDHRLQILFTVVTSLIVATEMVALFTSGAMLADSKDIPPSDTYRTRLTTVSKWFHFVGLALFLFSVALLSWLKMPSAAFIVSGLCFAALLLMGVVFWKVKNMRALS